MIERTLEHWRQLPHLRIREAAEIAGVCERTIEAELAKMETRTIGRIRFVTVESFRRWLGEPIDQPTRITLSGAVDPRTRHRAGAILRELTGR